MPFCGVFCGCRMSRLSEGRSPELCFALPIAEVRGSGQKGREVVQGLCETTQNKTISGYSSFLLLSYSLLISLHPIPLKRFFGRHTVGFGKTCGSCIVCFNMNRFRIIFRFLPFESDSSIGMLDSFLESVRFFFFF